ncbi:unnamed protein product, partial [Prorocentrum cordatum]
RDAAPHLRGAAAGGRGPGRPEALPRLGAARDAALRLRGRARHRVPGLDEAVRPLRPGRGAAALLRAQGRSGALAGHRGGPRGHPADGRRVLRGGPVPDAVPQGHGARQAGEGPLGERRRALADLPRRGGCAGGCAGGRRWAGRRCRSARPPQERRGPRAAGGDRGRLEGLVGAGARRGRGGRTPPGRSRLRRPG